MYLAPSLKTLSNCIRLQQLASVDREQEMEIELLAKQKIDLQKRLNALNSLKRSTEQSIPLYDKGNGRQKREKREEKRGERESACCNRLQLQMLQVATMKSKLDTRKTSSSCAYLINLQLMQ